MYLNDGQGGFPKRRRVTFAHIDVRFRMAAAADLDNDGLIDILASDERRGVSIHFGLDKLSFSDAVEIRRTAMP